MKPALLLNTTYEPISVVSWKQSFKLLISDKIQVLERYDVTVSSANAEHRVPSVIRLKERVNVKRKKIAFSRLNVYRRDNFRCQYCGDEFDYDDLTFDHVVPQSKGGQTNWQNIVTSCEPCNTKKDDRTPDEADMKLLSDPDKPKSLPFGMRLFYEDEPDAWEAYTWN